MHQIFLALVQANLTKWQESNANVDCCCNEAIVSNLVVQIIDVLQRRWPILHVFLCEGYILYEHSWMCGEKNPQHCQHNDTPNAQDQSTCGQFRTAEKQRSHSIIEVCQFSVTRRDARGPFQTKETLYDCHFNFKSYFCLSCLASEMSVSTATRLNQLTLEEAEVEWLRSATS